jgi:hypothetical protein
VGKFANAEIYRQIARHTREQDDDQAEFEGASVWDRDEWGTRNADTEAHRSRILDEVRFFGSGK